MARARSHCRSILGACEQVKVPTVSFRYFRQVLNKRVRLFSYLLIGKAAGSQKESVPNRAEHAVEGGSQLRRSPWARAIK